MGNGWLDDLGEPIYWYVFAGCNFIALTAWVISLIENNSSQVDRIWPIMPAIYSYAYFIVAMTTKGFASMPNSLARLIIVVVLVTLGAARLTWVFWMKGYYQRDHEDPRWAKLRHTFGKVQFFLFNLLFIGLFQNWVLFSLNSAVWFIVQNSSDNNQINFIDAICIVLFFFFLVYETIADYQQQKFQSAKQKWRESQSEDVPSTDHIYTQEQVEDFQRGFLIRGLFKYSRHPNYLGELGLWWTLYLFCIASQYPSMINNFQVKSILNWSIIPTIFFTLVFQLTTYSTEKSSAEKYPEYSAYKSKVSKILPWFTSYDPKSSQSSPKRSSSSDSPSN